MLLKAAKAQARFRATPQGALPAELWQLLMQDRWLDPANVSCIPSLCMNVFECMQAASCNPQAWCDGQGCPLPKPGGVPGPNGQRIINLLDPAGKMFYKALFELVPDRPAEHQYGYAGSRSRREAILQVEAWLDRLHAAGYSTATTLFDLTKAFDTLASSSIEDIIQREQMPDAARGLLLDLHRRLRISLKQADGTVLQMKLESGVLQGGGTGPRIFRMVYDERVSSWQNATSENEITVAYNGHICSLSTAAYADDLVRIQHGRTVQQLEERTVACTNALVQELCPCNLKLNAKKGEALLSIRGKGAYEAAKRAFSGAWGGYPARLIVKYLGAQLQSNGSLLAEVRKRIAAAKSAFARFSRFFKRSHVPLARKVLVFKAVVNEAVLSALEIRPLSVADCHALETARGLLLRRLFGRQGFGAVAGDSNHRSVTVESLRQRAQLATVSSELTVRRLLWFRKALQAEQHGQVRLELASLFGTCEQLQDTVDLETGLATCAAPRFLHLLQSDMSLLSQSFTGFTGAWKTDFLAQTVAAIKSLRSWRSPSTAQHPSDNTQNVEVQELELADQALQPEVLVQLMCEQCGAGPWRNQRALRAHVTKKHSYRNAVQSSCCPSCGRVFTTKSAAQRHVKRQSCGSRVKNHGHAGAIAGKRIADETAAAKAAAAAAAPKAQATSQPQASLRRYFQPSNAGHGLSSGSRESCRIAASEAQSARSRAQLNSSGAASARAHEATAEGLPSGFRSRPQPSRTRGLVYENVAVGSEERSCQTAASSHGDMEGQSTTRASSP